MIDDASKRRFRVVDESRILTGDTGYRERVLSFEFREFRVFRVFRLGRYSGTWARGVSDKVAGVDDFPRLLTGTGWLLMTKMTERMGETVLTNVDGEDEVDDDQAMYTRIVYSLSSGV